MEQRTYIPSLDGIRAISVIAVILYHDTFMPSGWVGVQVFFVLSGFLITGILLNSAAQLPSFGAYIGSFYLRRSFRIFPAYYLLICAMAVAHVLGHVNPHSPSKSLILLSGSQYFRYKSWC